MQINESTGGLDPQRGNPPGELPGDRSAAEPRRRETPIEVFVTFITVLILPLASFPAGSVFGPEWQNGEFTQRAGIHLNPEITIYFAPFIMIAWFAMLVAIVKAPLMATNRVARFLLYSSVPMTVHYLVLSSIVVVTAPIIAGLIVIGVWAALVAIHRRWGSVYVKRCLLIGFGLWALLAIAAIGLSLDPGAAFGVAAFPFFIVWVAGPAICFAVALQKSLFVWRLNSWRRTNPAGAPSAETVGFAEVGAVAWLVGYGVAWRAAVAEAAEIYNALPPEAPTCYVATAAAAGHRSVVGSHEAVAEDGESFAVTSQLQTLKLAEITIATLIPRSHRQLRRVYDLVGPPAAARLSSPVRADIAYLALKPAELLGRCIVNVFVPNAGVTRRRIYRAQT